MRDRVQLGDTGRVVLEAWLEREICERTLSAVEPLRAERKLSSFLLQLTPAFRPGDHQLSELEPLIELLAPVPVAIELRHRRWLRDPESTLAWFEAVGAAFVCVDTPEIDAPPVLPRFDAVSREDLAYLRTHGRNAEGYLRGRSVAERFSWSYSDDELHELASRARRLASDAASTRLMFGNGGYAMPSARRMLELLGRDPDV